MSDLYIFFDSPRNYEKQGLYYSEGSNPELLEQFLSFIDKNIEKISEIDISLYLFNNLYLLDKLKTYIERGIIINIISIPLDGYDDRYKKDIVTRHELKVIGNETKYSLAKKVYDEASILSSKVENFNLYIFPHKFVRSKKMKPFSRGILPYSLHIKSFLIKYKDGNGAVCLTSSNLATRDEVKENFLAIINNNQADVVKACEYFDNLRSSSILLEDFDEKNGYFNYEIQKNESSKKPGHLFYIAPFYEDSPLKIKDKLIELIKSAKDEIYICAQHLACDTSNDKDILKEALRATNRGVKINFLSQTFVSSTGDNFGQRQPQNTYGFKKFIKLVENNSNTSYFVNRNFHSKFLIIDDWIVLTSCNITPTEFTYEGNVDIPKFDHIPGISYKGIFSEVGQFMIFKSDRGRNLLIQNFRDIISSEDTYEHKGSLDRY
ncbi:phospholipase D family protein [Streptococcus salivarius]|uniref:phospholipase D family protein n=1 Tax=Streptococcus salivarius TaxID=1304 RepID=UPI001B7D39D4|nr:phospholipase D family protein [Streptococcus salivarius]